jgi:parvulin-like peptidyl-prolyl isomerase
MRQDLERMALMSREIRSRVNITPQDVERAWKEDPAYRTPEKIEVGDIFIPIGTGRDARERSRATADEAYEAARRNFAKAARKYSAGPNAQEGGILGTFVRDELAGGFVEALEKLEPGDVAPPFEADGAFHVVKLVRVVPSVPVPLDEVRGAIEDRLYSETLEARFNRWIDEDLRKRHHVTVQLQDIQALVAEENRS